MINLHKSTESFEFDDSNWFGYEKPSVLEAFRVLSKEGYYITISGHDYNMREKRLKKEYEENTKAPGSAENSIKGDLSGNKSIEHCGEPIPGSPLSAVEGIKLKRKDNQNTSENPALAEAASQFNDALLDEQAKKIDEQNGEITRLLSLVEKKENSISRLHYEKSVLEKENEELKKGEIPARYFDKALVDEQEEKIKKLEHEKLDILEIAGSCKRISAEQAKKIEKLAKENERLKDQIAILDACKKHNDKIDRLQIKRLGKEIARLNGIIHDKNEEIKRKTKGCCELITEDVDLKKNLSDKDAVLADVAEELRLSKIREKNLTEVCQKFMKEVKDLREKLANKVVDKIDAQALKSAESALAYKEKVIDKLTKENNDFKKSVGEFRDKIADMTIGKIDIQNIRLKEKDKEIKELTDKLKSINENHHKELTEKDEVITSLGKELAETKKQNTVVMVDMAAKCFRAARESINDVFESYAAKYAKSSLDDLKEKAYESFNAKAHNLGLVGSKDGNGILDRMEEEKKPSLFRDDSVGAVTSQKDCSPIKDTHPTEDNPEEVEMDEILELVRKALEEGHTVSINYDKAEEGGDQSATIVECGKDIDDVFKEIKRLCQE